MTDAWQGGEVVPITIRPWSVVTATLTHALSLPRPVTEDKELDGALLYTLPYTFIMLGRFN